MCLELMMPSFVPTLGNRPAAMASNCKTNVLAMAPLGATQ